MLGYATLDDIREIESRPLAERDLPPTTYEMLRRGAAIDPDAVALQFFLDAEHFEHPVSWTFRELMDRFHRVANALHRLGVGPNDVVSILLPNLPETWFTIYGGEAAAIVNPVNPLLEADTIAEILEAAGTRVLVALAPFPGTEIWSKVESLANRVESLETILQVDLAHYLDEDRRRAVTVARPPGCSTLRAQVLDFEACLEAAAGDHLESGREIRGDDVASYFHTGGTTGVPKLARHTHQNEAFDMWVLDFIVGLEPHHVLFCGLPLFHVNGVMVTGLWPWGRGASVVLGTPQGYRDKNVLLHFWKIVEHYRLSFFSAVPAVYSALLDLPVGDAKIASLELALCGAAPMPVEVFRRFEERTGLKILEGYGLTEGTCVSSGNPPNGERRIGSIGLSLPYQEMKTVILDQGGAWQRDAEDDEIGAVVIRGPNVFTGYKDEAHNQKAWIDTGDGHGPWLVTGDLGRRDAGGYFWLTGRAKELIIRGGHNIDPLLIEGPLHDHPAVTLAAAVGRPDPRVGEVPVAYVQLKPGAEADTDALLAFAREHIGERAAIPKAFHVVDEVPLTTVGKIFKPTLVRREIESVFYDELSSLERIASFDVEAVAHRIHGTLAQVNVRAMEGTPPEAVEEEVRRCLGRYAVPYEIHVSA